MSSTKRKQNVVTIKTKLETTDQLAIGVRVSFLAVCYNIGILIGPLLADVMMNYVIEKVIERTPLDHQPKFFCCYVDNCCATFTNTSSY